MKKIIIILFLTFTTNAFGQIKSYTLDESIQIGLAKSKNVEIYNSRLALSKANVQEISSKRYPKIILNATYMRFSDIPAFEIEVPFFPTPIKIQDPILDTYSLKLSLQQPLFTGFKLSSLHSAAEYTSKSSEVDYKEATNNEAQKIINAFWNIYKLKNKRKFIEERLSSLNSHLNDVKNFLENGLATRNDLLKIEVQYSTLNLKKIEVENALNLAKGFFNQLLGNPIHEIFTIEVDEIKIDKSKKDYSNLVAQAKGNRLELKSMDYKLKSAEEKTKASSSGWYPSVYLISDFYYSRPNQRIFPQRDQFDDSWDIGLSLNWDVWNWGYNSSQSQKAESNLKILITNQEKLIDAIEMDVYNAYLNYNTAIEKIKVSKASLLQAKENYRITNDKFSNQLVTTTELLDAEADLLEAKINLLNSKVDYQLSNVKLQKAIGNKLY